MASTIGIKLANGEFYPVLKENSQEKKRLILTTVHDNQPSIQIDLYRSSSRTMTDALYIGSLVMEKIGSQPKGQPSIELVISSSENGDITAHSVDLNGGTEGRQTLSVSLKSLDEVRQDYVISDFELEDDKAPPKGLYEPVGVIKTKKSWLPKLIIIVLILLLLMFAIWFLFFRGGGIIPCIQQLFQGSQVSEQPQTPAVSQQPPSQAATPPAASAPPAPMAQAPTTPAAQPAQTPPPPQATAPPPAQTETPTPPAPATPPTPVSTPAPTPPVIQAPTEPPPSVQVSRTRPVPPVASYNVPSVIPREGVAYRVRYGDTLWDISEAFYRNPWLYPRIARFNNIRNPDRIISGTTIRVPPRN